MLKIEQDLVKKIGILEDYGDLRKHGDIMGADVDTEVLAVSAINTIISKTGYLVSYIPTKDRGTSFDGCIEVYRHKGSTHKKDDMAGRVDVQVKGCKFVPPEIIKSSFSIDVSDLNNFLSAGGAMLLVVAFDSEGENEQAYYSRLLPFELKRILKECSENQKKKSVPLTKLPESKEEISDLFFNFVRDYNLQRAYINSSFEIGGNKKENLKEISFGYTSVQNGLVGKNGLPLKYMFTHGTYIYTGIGYDVKMPIDYMEKISVIFRDQPGTVISGNKLFYEMYKQIYFPDHEEIQIGKSHRFIFDTANNTLEYSYHLSGSLRERIKDEKFFVSIIENKSVEIKGYKISLRFNENEKEKMPDINYIKKHIEWIEKVDQTLKLVHAQEDLITDSLSDREERSIHLLVEGVLERKPVSLNVEESTFGTIEFGNQRIMICALRRNDSEKFDLFGYYDAPIVFKGWTKDKIEFDSSYFLMLTKNEMLKNTNIDLPEIIKRIKKISITAEYIDHVTSFLLELIKVYDETGNEEYFQSAMGLCEWIKGKDQNKSNPVHFINKCQLLKRKEMLTDKEINRLNRIAVESEDLSLKIGALILADKVDEAKKIYAMLDKRVQEIFVDYPICRFCPDIVG